MENASDDFPGKTGSKISFQTSPEVRHQFRRKLRQLHSGNRWCLELKSSTGICCNIHGFILEFCQKFQKGVGGQRGLPRGNPSKTRKIQASFLYPFSYAFLGKWGHISGELLKALFGGLFVSQHPSPLPPKLPFSERSNSVSVFGPIGNPNTTCRGAPVRNVLNSERVFSNLYLYLYQFKN